MTSPAGLLCIRRPTSRYASAGVGRLTGEWFYGMFFAMLADLARASRIICPAGFCHPVRFSAGRSRSTRRCSAAVGFRQAMETEVTCVAIHSLSASSPVGPNRWLVNLLRSSGLSDLGWGVEPQLPEQRRSNRTPECRAPASVLDRVRSGHCPKPSCLDLFRASTSCGIAVRARRGRGGGATWMAGTSPAMDVGAALCETTRISGTGL